MPPRPKKAAADAATPAAPEIDPVTGQPLAAADANTADAAAPEVCPYDPALESGPWTKWHHDREPQHPVLVQARNKKEQGQTVCIARVNGVAYWATRGVQKMVPLSVARIAYEAELSVLPVEGAVQPTFVGQLPPELAGAPAEG